LVAASLSDSSSALIFLEFLNLVLVELTAQLDYHLENIYHQILVDCMGLKIYLNPMPIVLRPEFPIQLEGPNLKDL
jgi:hypothetical protein